MLPRLCSVILGCLLAAACSDDVTATDGGATDSGDVGDAGTGVAPPEIPWLDDGAPPIAAPVLGPCADGWREVVVAGVTTCDPFPEAGAATCADGQAHFPGETACRSVGTDCPAGDFAAGLPTAGVVYVRAGSAAGGDGTAASPYAGLSEVRWSSLTDASTVALGRGSYEGSVPLRAGVRLVGACAAETFLTGLAAPVPAVVSVTSAGAAAVVEGLSIAGAPQAGAMVERGRALRLEGVIIEGVAEAGIYAFDTGTELTLQDVVVRDVRARESDGGLGRGVTAQRGARVVGSRVIAEANRDIGLFVSGAGSEMVVEDSVIRGTLPKGDGTGGRGISSQLGARFEGSRLVVTGNHDYGAYTGGDGAVLDLADTIVRGTLPHRRGTSGGHGLGAQIGALLTASRVLLQANEGGGIIAQDPDTRVTLTHVVITGPLEFTRRSRGISAEFGARVEASQTVVDRTNVTGVYVSGEGSEAVLDDVRIEDVAPEPGTEGYGRGIGVQDAGRLQATRVSVSGCHDLGIFLAEVGTDAALTDVVVRQTQARASDGIFGRGIDVERGAHLTASRLLVEENREIGLFADGDDTRVLLTDAVIRNTLPAVFDATDGRGVSVQLSATLDASRVLIDSNHAFGVIATFGTATMQDVTIQHTLRAECGDTTCSDAPYGYAASVTGGDLRLTRFVIEGAATCGVMVSDAFGMGGGVDLQEGVIRDSTIGACLQIDGYDLSRLMGEVVFLDNESNLLSTTLPVPDPSLGG